MMQRRSFSFQLLLAILVAGSALGCQPDRERCDHDQKYWDGLCFDLDAGADAGSDARADAGSAAGTDAGPAVGTDAGSAAGAAANSTAAAVTPPGSPGTPPGPRSGSG